MFEIYAVNEYYCSSNKGKQSAIDEVLTDYRDCPTRSHYCSDLATAKRVYARTTPEEATSWLSDKDWKQYNVITLDRITIDTQKEYSSKGYSKIINLDVKSFD